jgi:hypothetical protein
MSHKTRRQGENYEQGIRLAALGLALVASMSAVASDEADLMAVVH